MGAEAVHLAFTGMRMLDDLHHHPLSRLGANWAEDPARPNRIIRPVML